VFQLAKVEPDWVIVTTERDFHQHYGVQLLLRKSLFLFHMCVQYFYVERGSLVPVLLFFVAAIISNVLMARTVLMDPGLIPKFDDYYPDSQ
jgi:hypothetical protein